MGAADILHRLRGRGVTLIPEPGGNIRVRPGGVLTDAERDEIRAHKPELVDLLQRQQTARLAAPETPATAPETPPATPGNALHLVGMTTTSADRLAGYFELARRHGFGLDDAEVIADRLQMRDRLLIDMAMCIECRRLEGRRCGAARAGQMPSASRQFEPIRHELVRCPNFTPTTRTTP
jgi:hypothetical protein